MVETNRIEFKSQLTDDLDIEKEVISFLNYREGGIIYIGIDKDGHPIGVDKDEFFSGVSIPRNKELMRVFRDVEMVEALGSGMPVILRKYGREAYEFSEHFIHLVMPANENVPKNVPKNEPKNDTKNDTKKRRELIVNLIKRDNNISIAEIAKKVGVKPLTIKRELAEMRHIVQHVGPTRGGHWEFL